jgi:heme/copper-type cytochrome/quinol oxidase subunit 1
VNPLVRRYLKTAIGFLIAGITLGGIVLVRRELTGRYPSAELVSAHTHVILVGFVMMMILGVAQWMFPRPARDDPRYRPGAAEAAYWMLTLATLLRFAGEIARSASDGLPLRVAVVLGGLGQIGGLVLFFYNLWPRIRTAGAGNRAREE